MRKNDKFRRMLMDKFGKEGGYVGEIGELHIRNTQQSG